VLAITHTKSGRRQKRFASRPAREVRFVESKECIRHKKRAAAAAAVVMQFWFQGTLGRASKLQVHNEDGAARPAASDATVGFEQERVSPRETTGRGGKNARRRTDGGGARALETKARRRFFLGARFDLTFLHSPSQPASSYRASAHR